MKITMYELLGMVKDGKAPKRIKSEGHSYNYNEIEKDYYEGMGYDYEYLFKNTPNDRLNDTVEILEEEKKIPEKIDLYEDEEGHYFIDKHCKKIYITCDEVNFMVEEFNQLIDYLKSKGDE